MTHCNEHLLIKLFGQKGSLWDTTQLPIPLKRLRSCRESGKDGETKRDFFFLFCFVLGFVSLLALVCFDFFKFSFQGCCKGEGKIWGYSEVSGIRVHDIKFSKN